MPRPCNAGEIWSTTRRKCYSPLTRKQNYWKRVKKDTRKFKVFHPIEKIAETQVKLNKKDQKTLYRAYQILQGISNVSNP